MAPLGASGARCTVASVRRPRSRGPEEQSVVSRETAGDVSQTGSKKCLDVTGGLGWVSSPLELQHLNPVELCLGLVINASSWS